MIRFPTDPCARFPGSGARLLDVVRPPQTEVIDDGDTSRSGRSGQVESTGSQRIQRPATRSLSGGLAGGEPALGSGELQELEGDEIAFRLGRSPRFVDLWLARYRQGGIDSLRPLK